MFAAERLKSERFQWVSIAVLMLIAMVLRLETITSPPLEFEPTRQYKSYIITRSFYFDGNEDIPEWRREVAALNGESEERLEPPIMERIHATIFSLIGQEVMWLPRLVSAIFWLVGGIFLYLVARDLVSAHSALLSLAFYLLIPFGIPASRAFMPEPLMQMTFIISIFAILRFDRHPSRANLLLAGSITAFSIIIKGVNAFPIGGMYGLLLLSKYGFSRSVRNTRVWMFTIVSLLPALAFYGGELLFGGSLGNHLDKSFIPSLWVQREFWFDWLDILKLIFGFPVLVAGLVGILMVRDLVIKSLLIGLWVGYFVYGLITTRHIATHLYYSEPLIPIVALSLAPLMDVVLTALGDSLRNRFWRQAVWGVAIFALALNVYSTRTAIVPDLGEDFVAEAEAIGELVDHSTQVIYLSEYHGLPLKYHAEVVGAPWTSPPALGITNEDADLSHEARMDRFVETHNPEYFVITDMSSYTPDLREFLVSRFEVVAETLDYVVFDLAARN